MKVKRSTRKCSAMLPNCFSLAALVLMASCTAESQASKLGGRKAEARNNQKLASVEGSGTKAIKLSAKRQQLQLQADKTMQSPYSSEIGSCREGADSADYGGYCACGTQKSQDACWALRGEADAVQFGNNHWWKTNCIIVYLDMAKPTTCAPGCKAAQGTANVITYAGNGQAGDGQWECLTSRTYTIQNGSCREGANYGGVCACGLKDLGTKIGRDACWRLRGEAAAVQFADNPAWETSCITTYLDAAAPTTCPAGCRSFPGIANVTAYAGNAQPTAAQWKCLMPLPYSIEIGACREGPEPFAEYGGGCICGLKELGKKLDRDACWRLHGNADAVQFATNPLWKTNCGFLYFDAAAPTTCPAGCRNFTGIANVTAYAGNLQTGGAQWQCLKSRTSEQMVDLALQPTPEATSEPCTDLCAQRKSPGKECICPCQQNTLGRSPTTSQIVPMGRGATAEMCAGYCKKIDTDYFSYYFFGGSWECKCSRIYWHDLHYWEGGVTGQVNCFAAPIAIPVLPDPAVQTPSNLRSAPMYTCWASGEDWRDSWEWGQKWSHQSAVGNPLCYNSYTMSWEGFRFCKHMGSQSGQEYCKDITLDWCLAICEVTPDCIGIKWTKDNYCWMHTSALYVELPLTDASCQERAVFQKTEHYMLPIDEVDPPAYLDRKCPCGPELCRLMNGCFQEVTNLAENKACRDAQQYQGNLTSLRSAKAQCDLTLQSCQQVSPTCFLNLTLAWEQGLQRKHLNDGVTQALLQRSSRAHEQGFGDVDADHSGSIDITEFENGLKSLGYELSSSEVTKYFPADGVLSASEWNDMLANLRSIPAFCPCRRNEGKVALIQGSNMEDLGVEDDLDHVYERKACR